MSTATISQPKPSQADQTSIYTVIWFDVDEKWKNKQKSVLAIPPVRNVKRGTFLPACSSGEPMTRLRAFAVCAANNLVLSRDKDTPVWAAVCRMTPACVLPGDDVAEVDWTSDTQGTLTVGAEYTVELATPTAEELAALRHRQL